MESLKNISFGYFIKDENGRFPETGYLKGTIWDISAAITLTSIPWSSIKYCVGQMEESIDMMSASISKVDNAIMKDISINLGDSHDNVPEMASLMLLNAGIFYEEIAAHHPKIKPLSTISVLRNIPQESLINAWCEVLKIDYSPIFEVAVEIVKALPSEIASDVLSIMHGAVSKIAALHMTKSGDVYGKLYQTMIGRRKNIAAFYTKPIAAALLTGLVMPHSSDELWKNQDDLKKLRIADFACGSGMLLTHAYYHIKHCMNGDAGKLHAHLMENCFYGYDIMPTATHLTVSNLAGIYPDVFFKMTNIYTLPIGKSDHGYYFGSFDLLRDTVKFANAGLRHGGSGSKNVDAATMPPESCDYILMNPPYVRPTNHGAGRYDPVPGFAVFGIPPDIQREMSDVNNKLYAKTCSHGHAGWPSFFIAMCNKKIKPGGKIGLILPSSVISGSSWIKVRKLIAEWYDDITLIFLERDTFSAATGMNELMLIARKRTKRRSIKDKARIKTVILDNLPKTRLQAIESAKEILRTEPLRLEDDMSNRSVIVGEVTIGKMIDCPAELDIWWVSPSQKTVLFSVAYKLTHGIFGIPVVDMEKIVKFGKHRLDLIGDIPRHGSKPQGPFIKLPLQENGKYQALWNNNRKFQKRMQVGPDSTLEKKHDSTTKHAQAVWDTRTHVHINCQVRYNTQHIVAAYTEPPVIGGDAWPNVFIKEEYEKAFIVWCNSVFGIITYWAVAGGQQDGRGRMSRTAFKTFPILDFTKLTKRQLISFDQLFDKYSEEELLVINQLGNDKVRRRIDQEIKKIFKLDIDLESVYESLQEVLGKADK
ncbi:MAG: hypothetical protein MPI93_06330 [Nitrosopumilus sp.]|nr:hypothetical protein [Nitrosopumilus sp.]